MDVGGVDCGSEARVSLMFSVIWPRIVTTFEGRGGTMLTTVCDVRVLTTSGVKGGVDFMVREVLDVDFIVGWGYCVDLTARVEAVESIVELGRVNAADDSAVEGGFGFGFPARMNTRTSSHSMPGTYVKSMLALSSISLKVKRV